MIFFFWSPRIEREQKKKIISDVLGDVLDRPVLGLLHVLIDKQREPYFDNIVDEFERHRDLREGRIHAHVTAARPLEETQKAEIASKLGAALAKTVVVHDRVEPRLLGGLVVKLGDKVIDGSARRRLDKLRRALAAARD